MAGLTDLLREDGSGYPQCEVVHSLHQPQNVLCSTPIFWLLPCLAVEGTSDETKEEEIAVSHIWLPHYLVEHL